MSTQTAATRLWGSSPRPVVLVVLAIASVVGTVVVLQLSPHAVLATLERASELVREHYVLSCIVFALWSFLSLLLVVPTGTLSVIAGGWLLGGIPAAAIYVAMVFPATIVLMRVAAGMRRGWLANAVAARLPKRLALLPSAVETEGVATVAAMRLNPVVPNAVLCVMAPALGISLRQVLIGTVLTGWVRPVLFATAAELVGSASGLTTAIDAVGPHRLMAASAFAVAACILLAGRLMWRMGKLAQRDGTVASDSRPGGTS